MVDSQTRSAFLSTPQRVARWVVANPELTAVVGMAAADGLRYADLWNRALGWQAVLAQAISEKASTCGGEEADEQPVVALLRPRDIDVPAAQLGVWLCGGAYLPLDPATPATRIDDILSDARCSVVVTTDRLKDQLPADVRAVTAPGEPASDFVMPTWEENSLAYVIYTSGTSGRPKGVAIEHGSLTHLLDFLCPFFELGPGVRAATLCGLGFDPSAGDTWAALTSGAQLHVPDDAILRDIEAAAHFLENEHIQHCFLPTPSAEQLLTSGLRPRSLRTVYVGGDRLRVWPPTDFPAAVYNMYGPTEATVVMTSTTDLRRHPARKGDGLPPIGRPFPGCQVMLLDQKGHIEERPGEHGELYIGGPQLARGYYRNPELTAKSFVEVASPRGRWYRSGDICAWTPDGELEFVGRRDSQVKIRGYRIELSEIEQSLLRCSGVHQAVVLPLDRGGRRTLVGWVECEAGLDLETIRAAITEWLPTYMLPSQLTVLERLPVTPNGKIDRAALALAASAGEAGWGSADLRTATEEILAGVWEDLLGESASRSSDFFELGGDSLLAYQATMRVKQIFDLNVGLSALFENPEPRSYAAALDAQRRLAVGMEYEPLCTADRSETTAFPLTTAQCDLVTDEATKRPAPRQPILLAVGIEAPIDDEEIVAALNRVIGRHAALRMGFVVDRASGRAAQFARADVSVTVATMMVADGPADRRAAVRRARAELVAGPHSRAEPPLLRSALCRFADADAVLLLALDPLIADPWSTGLLFHELARALRDPSGLEQRRAVQFPDWLDWQERRLSGKTGHLLTDFWRSYLKDTGPFPPLDLPAPAKDGEVGGNLTVQVRLDVGDAVVIRAGCRTAGMTLSIAILSALALTWQHITGASDILVHTTMANRTTAEAEEIIGPLAHEVALRVPANPAARWKRRLQETRERVLAASLHQDLPLSLVTKEPGNAPHTETRPPARLVFTRHVATGELEEVPGGRIRRLDLAGDGDLPAGPGLSFLLRETDEDGPNLQIGYDPTEVEGDFVEHLAARLGAVVADLASEMSGGVAWSAADDDEDVEQ